MIFLTFKSSSITHKLTPSSFQALLDDIQDNKAIKDIIVDIKELALKSSFPEHEIIGLVSINEMFSIRKRYS